LSFGLACFCEAQEHASVHDPLLPAYAALSVASRVTLAVSATSGSQQTILWTVVKQAVFCLINVAAWLLGIRP